MLKLEAPSSVPDHRFRPKDGNLGTAPDRLTFHYVGSGGSGCGRFRQFPGSSRSRELEG